MRLLIAAIGRLRSGGEQALIDDYAHRIRAGGRPVGFSTFDIREHEAPKGREGPERQAREWALLEASAPPAAKIVLLDERGALMTSEAFAEQLGRWRDDGVEDVVFMIGGADGHPLQAAKRADLTLSFGRATFPHLLVRAMLTEQVYRAMTILAGHPYHRS